MDINIHYTMNHMLWGTPAHHHSPVVLWRHPTSYFTLHWAWVSPETEQHVFGRSKAEGVPVRHQACLYKAKSLTDKDALYKDCQSLLSQAGISLLSLASSHTVHLALSCGTLCLGPLSLWMVPCRDLWEGGATLGGVKSMRTLQPAELGVDLQRILGSAPLCKFSHLRNRDVNQR